MLFILLFVKTLPDCAIFGKAVMGKGYKLLQNKPGDAGQNLFVKDLLNCNYCILIIFCLFNTQQFYSIMFILCLEAVEELNIM